MLKFIKTSIITLLGIVAGTIFSFILIAIVATAIASSAMNLQNSVVTLREDSVLEINMDELIVTSPTPQSIEKLIGASAGAKEITLLQMFQTLEIAAQDDNIKAVSLIMDGTQTISLDMASQLREALVTMKEMSGKPIYAYAEDYSQVEYYLASVADSIFINPLGSIEWRGVAMSSLYYKDLLDGLNVNVEIFRPEACTYKSAVEPYFRTSMSEESRAQSQRIVDQIWFSMIEEVAESRKIPPIKLQRIAEQEVILDAKVAVGCKMASKMAIRSQYNEALGDVGVRLSKQQPRKITLSELALLTDEVMSKVEYDSDDKIAIIYADGVIGVDKSDYSGINADRLIRLLHKAYNDDKIKGVVLRVDSPGGGALAADAIAQEVAALRRKKLVVVSMGSVAASGGYYISAPADYIVASRFTITGSIGVYGMMLDLEQAAERHLHIYSDGVGSSPSADFGSTLRPINSVERRAIMRGVDNVYDTFKRVVAVGRKLKPERVDTLSQGRIWGYLDAFDGGLIDYIGGFKQALLHTQHAITQGDDMSLEFVELLDEPEGFEYLLSSVGLKMSWVLFGFGASSGLPLVDETLQQFSQMERGVITHTPLRVSM